jgi:hypothetical protein
MPHASSVAPALLLVSHAQQLGTRCVRDHSYIPMQSINLHDSTVLLIYDGLWPARKEWEGQSSGGKQAHESRNR